MSLTKTILAAAVAAVALASPALADFQYQGSPKFGEFYIYSSTQVSRPTDDIASQALNANAAMMRHTSPTGGAMAHGKSPFKGGIGNRAP
jgi:hypothetical protein